MLCDLSIYAKRVALIQGQQQLTYEQLQKRIDDFSLQLAAFPALYFLRANNDIDSIVAYLACLQSKHVIMLLDPDVPQDKLEPLLDAYQPNAVIANGMVEIRSTQQHNLSSGLALLLSTSGSTGSPKQVALSLKNLQANAFSICEYLPIEASDTTITTLPIHYSYGLSVINSHLVTGASIVLNQDSMLRREFWQKIEQYQVSSFAGVPYNYEMLLRLRFTSMTLPSLKYFTQAGGKLEPEKISVLARFAQENNKQFFVMYGQTEATARMAFMDQDKAIVKPQAIGRAIPGGEFKLLADSGQTVKKAEQSGELCYRGGNVMLGYARHYSDLELFTPIEWLPTGDLAYCDKQGDFVISGRLKRFIKVFGQRLNLDDIEHWLAQKGLETYCLGEDNKLQIAVKNNNDIKALKQLICQYLQIHHTVVQVVSVTNLPLTASNKKDRQGVKGEFDA